MKKFALIIAFLFSVLPTFSQQEKNVRAILEIKADTAKIACRLEEIYKEVAKIAADNRTNTDPLKKYLSQEFLKLYNELGYWESKLGEMIIGTDCWIRRHEWNKLEYQVEDIKITSPSIAVANMIAIDTWPTPEGDKKYTSKIRLDLVLENGNWMIDDFTDYNKVGELYESDSKLYREGIKGALDYFEKYNLIENEQ